MALTVMVGGGVGAWLDGRLGTSPLFLLALLMGGLGVGMYRLIKQVDGTEPDESDDEQGPA